MGPSPTILVPWPFHFGTDGNDFREIILDADHTGSYFLDLGEGDDFVIFDNTAVPNGNGKVSLIGGPGSDTMVGALNVSGNFVADGGSGDDYFDFDAVFFAYGSATVDGGDGDDVLHFTFTGPSGAGETTPYILRIGGVLLGGDGDDVIDILISLTPDLPGDPPSAGQPASTGHLVIDAGAGDDEVYLEYDLKNVTVSSFAFHGTAAVDLGEGNDVINWILNQDFDDTAPPPTDPIFTSYRSLVDIDLGAGDDCMSLLVGGDGPEGQGRVILGPLQISAGDGNDLVEIGTTGQFIDSIGMLNGNIITGAGDDNVVLNDVVLSNGGVDLGEGNDSLYWDFVLAGEIEVPPVSAGNGSQIYAESFTWVDAGAGNDTINIGGTFSFSESLAPGDGPAAAGRPYISWYSAGMRVDGCDGNDNINVALLIVAEDVEGEASATLVVNKLRGGLQIDGGDGEDVIAASFSFSESLAAGTFDVNGGEGNDVLDVSLLLFGDVEVDGAPPSMLQVSGGGGDDLIFAFASSDENVATEELFHVRGDAGSDTFVVQKGQSAIVIDDFAIGEDELFLDGIFSEVEWDATLISEAGPARTGIFDIDGNLIAVLQGIAPEDLMPGDIQFGAYA